MMAGWHSQVTQVVLDRCGNRFRLRQIKEGHVMMPVGAIPSKVSGNFGCSSS